MSDWNQKIINEFRENQGKVGGHFANNTLALLHSTGAKTGKLRVNPLICLQDGNNYIIVASNGGAESNPGWYYNILANPNVIVEFGTDKFNATARSAEGAERTELYAKMEAVFKTYTEYREKTHRIIPVVVLTKA